MHVKDLTVKTDQKSETKVGRGVIDFPALFRTLIEVGYKGQLGLEYETEPNNRLPGMIESMAYMRGVLAARSLWFANIPIRANHVAKTSRTERSVGPARTLTARLFSELRLRTANDRARAGK